jgi:hypothetical protein
MENKPSYQPRREHTRFKAQERSLVLLPQEPEALPYHIVDISEGGLSFRCLAKKNKSTGITAISLYNEYEMIVKDLPVKAVSDRRLRGGLVPVHRRSLCFKSLSIKQRNRLSTFIEHFTEHRH